MAHPRTSPGANRFQGLEPMTAAEKQYENRSPVDRVNHPTALPIQNSNNKNPRPYNESPAVMSKTSGTANVTPININAPISFLFEGVIE